MCVNTAFAWCGGWYSTGSPNQNVTVYFACVYGSTKEVSNCACAKYVRATCYFQADGASIRAFPQFKTPPRSSLSATSILVLDACHLSSGVGGILY